MCFLISEPWTSLVGHLTKWRWLYLSSLHLPLNHETRFNRNSTNLWDLEIASEDLEGGKAGMGQVMEPVLSVLAFKYPGKWRGCGAGLMDESDLSIQVTLHQYEAGFQVTWLVRANQRLGLNDAYLRNVSSLKIIDWISPTLTSLLVWGILCLNFVANYFSNLLQWSFLSY